ncbi:hypothetical protein [Dysgonomonas termitidis]|uniref:Uncharacterized protein n=1 Tax=Dysgonomonas termitidis TaxID=1516126 RepID=A0ABV9KV20_9BACT
MENNKDMTRYITGLKRISDYLGKDTGDMYHMGTDSSGGGDDSK